MGQGWYYKLDGVVRGPVPAAELRRLAAAGKLGPADVVRRDDMEKWLPAGQVKGLFTAPVAATTAGGEAPVPVPARPVAARPATRPRPKGEDDEGEEQRPAGPREERRVGRRKMGTPVVAGIAAGGVLLLGLVVTGAVLLLGGKKAGEPGGGAANVAPKEGAAVNPVGKSWSEIGTVPWKSGLQGYALTPDGKTLAVAGDSLKLYDVATGREEATLTKGYPRTPTYARTGELLAWYESGTKYGDSGVRVWDADRKQIVTRIKAHAAGGEVGGKATFSYTRPTFTPDGTLLVTSSRGDDRAKAPASEVRVWDAATGQPKADLPGSDPVAVSGDGKLLAMAGRHKPEVVIWNLTTMAEEKVVPLPQKGTADRLTHLAVRPDGKAFATVTGEGVIVWDTATGQRQAHLLKSDAAARIVNCYGLGYSPDGSKLAVAVSRQFAGQKGVAYEARVWDVATGLVARFPDASGVEFASAGDVIACFYRDQFRVYTERPGDGAVAYRNPDDVAGEGPPPPKDDAGGGPSPAPLTRAAFVQKLRTSAFSVSNPGDDGQRRYTFDNKADFFRKMGQPESSEEYDVEVPFDQIGKVVTARLTYRCTDGRLLLDIDHTAHSAWYTVLRVREVP
jgi:WD40 repeat protein